MYYVIDSDWVNEWVNFIKNHGPLPGEIDNSRLKTFILEGRKRIDDYKNYDNELHLK